MTMNATTITVAGNLGTVPAMKTTENGKSVLRLNVAAGSRYLNGRGEWVDGPTSWHNVVVWGALAENLADSLSTGDRVVVHGRLEQRGYTTDEGDNRSIWEITADEIGVSLAYATARPVKKPRGTAAP